MFIEEMLNKMDEIFFLSNREFYVVFLRVNQLCKIRYMIISQNENILIINSYVHKTHGVPNVNFNYSPIS